MQMSTSGSFENTEHHKNRLRRTLLQAPVKIIFNKFFKILKRCSKRNKLIKNYQNLNCYKLNYNIFDLERRLSHQIFLLIGFIQWWHQGKVYRFCQ